VRGALVDGLKAGCPVRNITPSAPTGACTPGSPARVRMPTTTS